MRRRPASSLRASVGRGVTGGFFVWSVLAAWVVYSAPNVFPVGG